MHFFKNMLNLDHVERIEWAADHDRSDFTREDILSCKIFFESGDERLLWGEAARDLFDYLEASHEPHQAQASKGEA